VSPAIKDSPSLEAFYRELNALAEAYPMVTLLAVTPDDHNHFLPEEMRKESWGDPLHQRFKDALAEEIDSTHGTPWDSLNNLSEKIAERIKEDEE